MAVSAVHNDNNYGKMSYISSTALGGLSGYCLKYMIPIAPQEKDDEYKSALKEINRQSKSAKNVEIEKIKLSSAELESADEFIRMYNNKTLTSSNIRKLDENVRKNVLGLFNRVQNSAKEAGASEKRAFIARIKDIRPTSVFVLTGVLIGMTIAFMNNLSKMIAKNKENVQEP